MLFLDVNVVVRAHRPADSERSAQVREWLVPRLTGSESIGVSEFVLSAMIRIATNGRIFTEPSPPSEALAFAQALLDAPAVTPVRPGGRHWRIFSDLVSAQRLRANDVPDAYLAAIAVEHRATLVTSDQGFARFPDVHILDPLQASRGDGAVG